MYKDKLVLNNEIEIQIESFSSLPDIKVISRTKYDMLLKWDLLTEENLKFVQLQNSDGTIIGKYQNLILDSETSTTQKDGTILTSFCLREKTEVELLRERIEQLENGQEVQDEAISDLGTAVSDLTEGGIA